MVKLRVIFVYVLIFCVLGAPPASGASFVADRKKPQGPVRIEADSLSYDSERDVYRADGSVIITYVGGALKAEAVTLNRTTGEVRASGDVVIESDGDVLRGECAEFNVETKTGRVRDGTIFFAAHHLYLSGRQIEKKGDATYSLQDATATTCDGDTPAWRFTGKAVDVTIDGYGTLRHGSFQIKNLPFLYLPYLIFPAKTTRQTGFLLPRLGYSTDKHGVDVMVPFYWVISENVDATFYQRYLDKRGFQEGVEFRYNLSQDSYGTLYGDYLNDQKEVSTAEEDELPRTWAGSQARWAYYWNHETALGDSCYVRTDLRKVSDNWYFRDFDSYNYFLEHYETSGENRFRKISFLGDKSLASLDSTARFVKDWKVYNFTALGRYTDDYQNYSNDATLQKYPEVTLTGVTHPLFKTPINFELDSLYGYYYRTEGFRGHQLDVHPVFSYPVSFGDYLQLTPQAGVRETTWDSKNTMDGVPGKRGSRELYDVGLDASTELQRIFNIDGETVEKVKHAITPEFTYTYIPYVYQDDLADFVPSVSDTNAVTYALTNTLIARLRNEAGTRFYREVLRLKVSQTYDIQEARRNLDGPGETRRPFSAVDMEFNATPFQYFSCDADARFDVNSGEWKQINTNVDVRDARGDSVDVEYRYTQNSIEEVNLSLFAKVSASLDAKYVLRRNEREKRDIESTYGLTYHQQCWSVEVAYSDITDDRTYMVIFSLYGLGKVGRVSGGTESVTNNF